MSNIHNASGSFLGYLAQCRYALLEAINSLPKHPGHSITIEKFDDIAFEQDGTPLELIQSKHSCSPSNVSDVSVDIWKTIRIWVQRVKGAPDLAAETRFVFLTTATASPNSALELLRIYTDQRDTDSAHKKLVSAAMSSKNESTEMGRSLFLELDEPMQKLLVGNIWVFDSAPNIIDVRDEIEAKLVVGVPPGKLSEFTDRLEGWWFRQVINSLSNDLEYSISLASVLAKIAEIRDEFRVCSLPLDPTIAHGPMPTLQDNDQRNFVQQMRIIELPTAPISGAVQDYYRAYTQRSKWIREDLLLDDEAENYDHALIDSLERKKHALDDDFDISGEDQAKSLGRSLFHWSRSYTYPLRNRHELWLSSGSYQMLSDRKLIGWHPNYEVILTNLDGDND